MLILTIGTLVIALVIGLADKAIKIDRRPKGRRIYIALYLLTFGVAGFAAFWQDRSGRVEKAAVEGRAKQRQAKLEADLAFAHEKLRKVASLEAITNALVGDLAKLGALGGDGKYYVRIAADRSREGLAPYLRGIEGQFAGAHTSGLVAIREPRSPGGNFELAFGQQLSLVAAEVFQRLAMSHHFPPKDQVAAIIKE